MLEKISKEQDLEVSVNVSKSTDGSFVASAIGIKFATISDDDGKPKSSMIKKKVSTIAQGKSFDEAKTNVLTDLVTLLGIGG